MTQPHSDSVAYRTFRPGDEAAFLRLNEDWISKYFDVIEPADRVLLDDPRTHILDPGGQICIAELRGETIGCCALISIAPGEFELAKMTVAETARAGGIGRKLLQFAINVARIMGARRLYLESNTKAAAAIHLYEQLGFRHLPGPPHESKYVRANVFMELQL
ncbi:MAG: GNAT family N-acetyltransferase [Acidobacteriaceae bacterium]|jgi:N-acetylglutamate synthase-like GNAT family acetyltransferase